MVRAAVVMLVGVLVLAMEPTIAIQGAQAQGVTAPPTVTLFPNSSNVFGRAQPNASSGAVQYLGKFDTPTECQDACLAFDGNGGQQCNSFSHHSIDFPSAEFQGHCYGIIDHSWNLRDGSCPGVGSCITSGQVNRELPSCGAGTADGCKWLTDPTCLDLQFAGNRRCGGAGEPVCKTGILVPAAMMTIDEACIKCAALTGCLGFTYTGSTMNISTPVNVTLVNTTAEISGSTNCWTRRQFYQIDEDPFRTAFHFQPSQAWMNDPNGPMYYKGLYHLFWQWNPSIVEPAASGGFVNMHWGHAVSKDMLGWKQLPIALSPDPGSCGGEWSGSATVDAPQGVTLSYSVQCNSYFGQAYPEAPDDPLLVNWTANNIVGHKAPGTGGFRDPSTAWLGSDGIWRQLLACNGAACLYNSTDFKTWNYVGHIVGSGEGPTYEMPDIFKLPGSSGLYFIKVGMENGTDYWSTGTFSEETNTMTTANGIGSLGAVNSTWDSRLDMQRCDYGSFYSSKTFALADPSADEPRHLIGWVGEESGSPLLQWAGIQSLPRDVSEDPEIRGRAVFNPTSTIASLRDVNYTLASQSIPAHSAIKLGVSGNQLDIVANFSGPFSAGQSFGVVVLASASWNSSNSVDGPEATSVVVQIASVTEGILSVGPHHGSFTIPTNGQLDLRVIVDHSIVECFVAGGRAAVTRRVYPRPSQTQAYVFNGSPSSVLLLQTDAYTMKVAAPPKV